MTRKLAAVAAVALLLPLLSAAQDDPESAADSQADDEEPKGLNALVVTGRAGASSVTKFETSYAVSDFSEDDIRTQKPLNVADLLGEVPGFWAENSGGEGGNNIFVRGIPADGSFRYAPLLEDSLPLFEEAEVPFMNADQLARIDASIANVEVVRGGTASIFHSNAAGGVVNFITKKGSNAFEGLVQFDVTDYGQYRTDFSAQGPLSDNVQFAIGGFFRSGDGLRDPGFRANEGGQVRGNLRFMLDRGTIDVNFKRLDDQNTFYLPLPLADPTNGGDIANFDVLDDTLTTNDARVVNLLTPNGVQQEDLGEGIHPEVSQFGASFDFELGDGWYLRDNVRYIDGQQAFNAIFSLTAPVSAQARLDAALARLQAANPGAVVDNVDYRYTNFSGDAVDFNGNGLVIETGWWAQDIDFQNFQNDLQINKFFILGSQTHDITVGGYFSSYDLDSDWNFNTILTEVDNAPRLLDICGDVDGDEVCVTNNGFVSYGDFLVNDRDSVETTALYLSDNWQITDALRLDLGLRYQNVDMDGTQARSVDTVDLGDPTTLSDNAVGRLGAPVPYDVDFDDVGFTIGANYEFSPEWAVFGRYVDTFRTPRSFGVTSGSVVEDIDQVEFGLKFNTPEFNLFATFYFNQFSPFIFNNQVVNANGEIETLNLQTDTEAFGVEWEANWTPLPGWQIQFSGTWQKPEYNDFLFSEDSNGDGVIDPATESFDFSGNQVRRIPELMLSGRVMYDFFTDYFGGRIYGQVQHVDDRFVDAANTTVLPSYTVLNAGVIFDLRNGLSLGIVGHNLTNEEGITEGNPRSGQITGQGVGDVQFGRPIFGRNFNFTLSYAFY
ncbi:MAG: TonB-dependent receptor [Wenzhouxiangellaceae bacterium]